MFLESCEASSLDDVANDSFNDNNIHLLIMVIGNLLGRTSYILLYNYYLREKAAARAQSTVHCRQLLILQFVFFVSIDTQKNAKNTLLCPTGNRM